MDTINALIINAGSTTTKYSLFSKGVEKIHVLFEKKGNGFYFTAKDTEKTHEFAISEEDFIESPRYIVQYLISRQIIETEADIEVLGFRVVHGGEYLKQTTEITESVLSTIEGLSEIAPLHNPPAARIIRACQHTFSKSRFFAVFDTAFHSSIPDYAFTYELPRAVRDQYHIRKYGFHGISYSSMVRQLRKQLPVLPARIIACHLGGGCSITAILDGKSLDTSMGFSPLEGLMMMTRPGDIDAGALLYLEEKIGEDKNVTLEKMLNKESGVKGITEGIDDMREVIARRNEDPKCALALNMFTYKIKKYIGAYSAAMGGIDMLVFSGGIGAGSEVVRSMVTEGLDFLDVKLDEYKNRTALLASPMQKDSSRVVIMTLDPEENIEIYNEVREQL